MNPFPEAELKLLIYWGFDSVAELLRGTSVEIEETGQYGGHYQSYTAYVYCYAPVDVCEELRRLPADAKKAVLDSFREITPPSTGGIDIDSVDYFVDPLHPTDDTMKDADLIKEIDSIKNTMIAVATGGPRINTIDDKYKIKVKRIRSALASRGIKDPNPYDSLWDWYGKWSSGDLPRYEPRRQYIRGLFQPLLNRLQHGLHDDGVRQDVEPTGWARVDRNLTNIREQLESAKDEEEFQAVGLLSRETLISLANEVYNPATHETPDGITPSKTDAKRKLDAYLMHALKGKTNEVLRKHARASLDLANDLQHRRTASYREAALCAEATTSVVNIIAIVAGKRDDE